MQFEFHDIANIFPLIEGREFKELIEDIKKHGCREPVVLFEGKILDGRNRYRACRELNIAPEFIEFTEGDPLGFVVSLNLHRRHLTESQRAMVASKIANLENGQAGNGRSSANLQTFSRAKAAEMLNVSERTVNAAKKIFTSGDESLIGAVITGKASVYSAADVAELPKDKQAEIVAKGEKEILEAAKKIRAEKAEARRTERVEKINEISKNNVDITTGLGKYAVIYADPPWRYEYIETESRAIENQYPTMSLDDICALPVADVALDDCVLFMWATSPKLEEAFQVLKGWGFAYRTCAVWDKELIGMGYYFRQQHELLLIATRGQPVTPLPANRPGSIFRFKRGAHSAKPVEFYEAIEAMYPEFEKIELFCRTPRIGWQAWGNQASG